LNKFLDCQFYDIFIFYVLKDFTFYKTIFERIFIKNDVNSMSDKALGAAHIVGKTNNTRGNVPKSISEIL